jgi:putative DNA primase/helicase
MQHYASDSAIERDIEKVFTTENPNHPDVDAAPVLSPASPVKSARAFIKRRYTTPEGLRTLVHWRGDWLVWTGTHYRPVSDDSMTAELYQFLDTARVRAQPKEEGEAAQDKPFNPDQAKVNKILHALKAEVFHREDIEAPSFRADCFAELFGTAGEFVACKNGLVHLRSGVLVRHEPEMFNLNALGFAFDPQAVAPRWLTFLETILPGDQQAIDTLQEIFGYIVSGELCLEKIFCVFGPPRSGKGTIVKILSRLLCDENVKEFTIGQLSDRNGMEDFVGKSLLVMPDAHIEGRGNGSAVERLKMISGNDRITVGRKYKTDWTGTLPGRILIVTNNEPRLDDNSGAIATRIVPIRLMRSFLGRENLNLLLELLPELPGIFNWARAGWQRLMARGHFIVPASAQSIVDDIRSGASPVSDFIDERCILAPEREADCVELWAVWQSWCERKRLPCGSWQSFGRALASAIPTLSKHRGEKRGSRERFQFYRGIGLNGRSLV